MNSQPLSVLHTLARHYARDAQDFLDRFNVLWERQPHKTGRIKSFVDLLLACECVLKAHVILGRIGDDPDIVYQEVRGHQHDISALADAARLLDDRTAYQFLKDRLGPFSVFIRYSLDAYETFFPSAMERADASIRYSNTIGNDPWVLECRDSVSTLVSFSERHLSGFVSDDLSALMQNELQMKEFADNFIRRKK